MQPFTGKTIADAYDHLTGCIHIPRYPRYTTDNTEPLTGDFPYFYHRSQRYIECQSARFCLLGGNTLPTLVPPSVIHPQRNLSPYWHGFFRERFAEQIGEIIHYQNMDELWDYCKQHHQQKLLSPYPFDSSYIDPDRYYLDPSLVAWLNNKGNMHHLSSCAVPADNLTPDDFANKQWREQWSLPFVIKLTTPSGGGDGVMICETEADIDQAQRHFAGMPVKIERYLPTILENINVNLCVKKEGQIDFIGGSRQKIGQDENYKGNRIDFRWQPSTQLAQHCKTIAHRAWQRGWYGVCGLDMIKTAEDQYYFIDPNFRLNGSTPFYLLRDYFEHYFSQPLLETGYFSFVGSPVQLLNTFAQEIETLAFTPIGIYYDPRFDDTTRVYAALAIEAEQGDIAALHYQLKHKGLIEGINLN